MKILAGIVFLFSCFICSAQELTKKQAQSMLQGLWVFASDPKYTMVFSGDTIVEYHLGEKELDVIPFYLSDKGCKSDENEDNNQGLDTISEGVYIILEGDEEEPDICAALVFQDEKHLLLMISENRGLELEKKL